MGQQDFILNKERELSSTEAELYFKTADPSEIEGLQEEVYSWVKTHYPQAVISFAPPENIFEKIFVTGEPDIVAEVQPKDKTRIPEAKDLRDLETRFRKVTGVAPMSIAFENQLNLSIDREKLLLYKVSFDEVYKVLKTAFKDNEVTLLRSYQQYLPITIAGDNRTVDDVLQNTLIQTQPDNYGNVHEVPLKEFVRELSGEDLKSITAGSYDEYVPYKFYDVKSIIRLGSCGAYSPDLNIFDTILVNNSYTEGNFAYGLEGVNCHLIHADDELNSQLINTAEKSNIKLISGDVLCSEVFDYYVKDLDALISRFPKDLNIIGAEMESFALFYTAKYLNKKAACLLTVVDSHYKKQEISADEREKSLNTMINIALESL